MNMSKSDRVLFWDDERSIGNSIIVTLAYGWYFTEKAEHVMGFDTIKEAKQAVRDTKPCDCEECLDFKNKQKNS
jgi:hypothetical protein